MLRELGYGRIACRMAHHFDQVGNLLEAEIDEEQERSRRHDRRLRLDRRFRWTFRSPRRDVGCIRAMRMCARRRRASDTSVPHPPGAVTLGLRDITGTRGIFDPVKREQQRRYAVCR